ncbi:MAG: ATP-binding protein [Desulfobulbaceae bacterium]|uniref:ATP-binding protein n=1 Tax=Candidatus Desulfobia pelagia TaxID=2841692 RepID=A0A8J6TGI1_9BACT|nr:ATP-binding protein [Candidatus Desulfobia pelagia]
MNNQGTLEKMHQMKLYGMARAFQASLDTGLKKDFTADELLAHLVDAEWDDRHNRKMNRLMKSAKFRYQASLEQINFRLKRNLDKNLLLRLADCSWIQQGKDVIISGETGLGKSFIASALGHQGCQYGYTVKYFNCAKLFSQMKLARAEGTYIKKMDQLQKQALLVLDDFGIYPFDMENRLILLELLEDRHGRKSTVVASQFPTQSWYELIGEPTIADAICDRLIHTSYQIKLKGGESIRKTKDHLE